MKTGTKVGIVIGAVGVVGATVWVVVLKLQSAKNAKFTGKPVIANYKGKTIPFKGISGNELELRSGMKISGVYNGYNNIVIEKVMLEKDKGYTTAVNNIKDVPVKDIEII
jgi:hypothetical protein